MSSGEKREFPPSYLSRRRRNRNAPRRRWLVSQMFVEKRVLPRSSRDVAMPHLHAVTLGREPPTDFLDEHDRAMSTASTAEGEREVRFALVKIPRQKESQQALGVIQEFHGLGTVEEK